MKKGFVYLIIIVVLLLTGIMIYNCQNKVIETGLGNKNISVLEPIHGKYNELDQTFVVTTSKTLKIKVKVATYEQILQKGKVIFELYNSKNQFIKKQSYKASEFRDNDSIYLDFKLKNCKGKKYHLKIKLINIEKETPITFYTTTTINPEYHLFYNQKEMDSNLFLKVVSKNKDFNFRILWYCFLITTVFSIGLLFRKNRS